MASKYLSKKQYTLKCSKFLMSIGFGEKESKKMARQFYQQAMDLAKWSEDHKIPKWNIATNEHETGHGLTTPKAKRN